MSTVLMLMLVVSGNVYQDVIDQGNQAYTENRLEDAIVLYERVVASGIQSAPVYYNLATAYYHAGEPGHAVLNYDRALALHPGFSPAMRGLEAVSGEVAASPSFPEGYDTPVYQYQRWIRGLGLAFWWVIWGILLASRRKSLRHGRAFVIGALIGVILLLGMDVMVSQTPQAAVLVAEESALRYGPDFRDVSRQSLHAGDRLGIRRVRGEWVQVETNEQVRGWVLRGDLRALWPIGR